MIDTERWRQYANLHGLDTNDGLYLLNEIDRMRETIERAKKLEEEPQPS